MEGYESPFEPLLLFFLPEQLPSEQGKELDEIGFPEPNPVGPLLDEYPLAVFGLHEPYP